MGTSDTNSKNDTAASTVGNDAPRFDVDSFFDMSTDVSLDDIVSGRRRLFADAKTAEAFRDEVKARLDAFREKGLDDTAESLRLGLALFFLAHPGEALDVLDRCKRLKLAPAVIGLAQLDLQQFGPAAESLAKACDDPAAVPVTLLAAMCEAQRLSGDESAAQASVAAIAKREPESAAHYYAQGIMAEMGGDVAAALDAYQQAASLEPDNQRALFRLAYNLDLRGEDEMAIETYKRCNEIQPVYIGAMINLGVLHEDAERYSEAISCFRQVVKVYPNHPRAKLFLRDSRASTSMYYDEEKERRADKRQKVLEIPVTDFELSVRSRNCLEKMNIRNLGDLTRVSEQELLKFKNFGETSLTEIKDMMDAKGLSLGQALESPDDGDMDDDSSPAAEERRRIEALMAKSVMELELSKRARQALDSMQCDTLGDLVSHTEDELLNMKNFGQTSLNEIMSRLEEMGLTLGQNS